MKHKVSYHWIFAFKYLSLSLATSLVYSSVAQAGIYRKLYLASSKTPQHRIKLFTQSYKFSPQAIKDVEIDYEGVWQQQVAVSTKNGRIKLNVSDRNKQLEFSSFESDNILNVGAYREVEVTRIVEGRSWAPEFGAAVIPDSQSRTGWSNAVYQPPKEGRVVYNRVTQRETQQYRTQGFFLVQPHNPYIRGGSGSTGLSSEKTLDISLAHKVEREVVVPGSTEWVGGATGPRLQSDYMKAMVNESIATARLSTREGSYVYSEVQQMSGDKAMLLVVRDTKQAKLVGDVHEVTFNERSISVNQTPVKNSRVYIDRDVLGLDLPKVQGSSSSRSRQLIED